MENKRNQLSVWRKSKQSSTWPPVVYDELMNSWLPYREMYGSNSQQSGMPQATTVFNSCSYKAESSLRNAGQNACAWWAVSMTFLSGNPNLLLGRSSLNFSTTLYCTHVQLPMNKGISHFTKRIHDQISLTTRIAQRSWMRVRGTGVKDLGKLGLHTVHLEEQSMGMVQRQWTGLTHRQQLLASIPVSG